MKKNNIITLRLTDDELGWLGALCRRSRQSKSETIRSLIMNGFFAVADKCENMAKAVSQLITRLKDDR